MAAPPRNEGIYEFVMAKSASLSSLSLLSSHLNRTGPPPSKKVKECTTISMVVERWRTGQGEQFSAVHRIGGFPWSVRLSRYDADRCVLSVICDKSSEAELWQCSARPTATWAGGLIREAKELRFSSWDEQVRDVVRDEMPVGTKIDVEFENVKGEWSSLRPTLDQLAPHDGILVIGAEKDTVHVHKQDLASQSAYFNRLFFGNHKNRNKREFTIEDVEYEEFSNILKMIYGRDSAPLTESNVPRLLTLASKFDLKIVEDRVVSYLLSSASAFSMPRSLVIAQTRDLGFLKANLIARCTEEDLVEMAEPRVWERLTNETTRALLKRRCEIDRVKEEEEEEW